MNFLNFHTHRLAHVGETALCSCSPHEFVGKYGVGAANGAIAAPGAVPESEGSGESGTTFFSLGIHPWKAAEADGADWEQLQRLVRLPVVRAMGEVGMDVCCTVPRDVQCEVFRRQVLLAEELRKPLFVHCVRMADEVLAVRRQTAARQPWIWHGFRGGPQQLEQFLRHGFYFSFGLRHRAESLAACPAERLLLETDEANTDIRLVYETAAALRGVSLQALLGQMQANFQALFGASGD